MIFAKMIFLMVSILMISFIFYFVNWIINNLIILPFENLIIKLNKIKDGDDEIEI